MSKLAVQRRDCKGQRLKRSKFIDYFTSRMHRSTSVVWMHRNTRKQPDYGLYKLILVRSSITHGVEKSEPRASLCHFTISIDSFSMVLRTFLGFGGSSTQYIIYYLLDILQNYVIGEGSVCVCRLPIRS